jgi:hypothetical protein
LPILKEALDHSPENCKLVFPTEHCQPECCTPQRADTKLTRMLGDAIRHAGLVTGYKYSCRRKGCGHHETHREAHPPGNAFTSFLSSPPGSLMPGPKEVQKEPQLSEEALSVKSIHSDLAGFFHSFGTMAHTEQALVVAYWLQVVEGLQDFESQRVNSEMHQMGSKAANITRVMTLLIERKPSLIIQAGKSGSAQQARKRYRVSEAGLRRVREMMAGTAGKDFGASE